MQKQVINPPAEILFERESTAQFLWRKHKVDYPKEDCLDGSGIITVRKPNNDKSIVKTVLANSAIELVATCISLGHYIPNDDFQPHIPWHDNRDVEEWLEQVKQTTNVTVRFNVKQQIELEVHRNYTNGVYDFSNASDDATVRFKEVMGTIDLCRCDGSERLSLIMAIKHPPKLLPVSVPQGLVMPTKNQILPEVGA